VRSANLVIALALVAVARTAAHAADCQPQVAYDQFSLRAPIGFQPQAARDTQRGVSYAFRENKPESEAAAVLQLLFTYTQDDFSKLDAKALDELKIAHLNRYLGGIAGRRKDFVKSAIEDKTLHALAFKAVAWSGETGGEALKGAMYSTVIKNVAVLVSAQAPEPKADEALLAIEQCLDTLELTPDQ
jgi:hypothetical protein